MRRDRWASAYFVAGHRGGPQVCRGLPPQPLHLVGAPLLSPTILAAKDTSISGLYVHLFISDFTLSPMLVLENVEFLALVLQRKHHFLVQSLIQWKMLHLM